MILRMETLGEINKKIADLNKKENKEERDLAKVRSNLEFDRKLEFKTNPIYKYKIFFTSSDFESIISLLTA